MVSRILFFGVSATLATVIQLLASSTGSVIAGVLSAVVVTIISHALWSFADLNSKRRMDALIPAGGAFLGVVIGIGLHVLQSGFDPLICIAIPAGVLTSSLFAWIGRQDHSETCFHHRVRIKTAIQCPRCHQKFCGRSDCWASREVRCQRCKQNEVLLLNPRDELWWTKRFGNRVSSGSCVKCLATAGNTE